MVMMSKTTFHIFTVITFALEVFGQDFRKYCKNDDPKCQCPPAGNSTMDICKNYKCQGDSDCTGTDPNRYCFKSFTSQLCLCQNGYYEDDENDGVCVRKETCSRDVYCTDVGHRVCVDGQCRCEPNYRWHYKSRSCLRFECTNSDQCQNEWDKERQCDNGECICSDKTEQKRFKRYARSSSRKKRRRNTLLKYKENPKNGRKCEKYRVGQHIILWVIIGIGFGTSIFLILFRLYVTGKFTMPKKISCGKF